MRVAAGPGSAQASDLSGPQRRQKQDCPPIKGRRSSFPLVSCLSLPGFGNVSPLPAAAPAAFVRRRNPPAAAGRLFLSLVGQRQECADERGEKQPLCPTVAVPSAVLGDSMKTALLCERFQEDGLLVHVHAGDAAFTLGGRALLPTLVAVDDGRMDRQMNMPLDRWTCLCSCRKPSCCKRVHMYLLQTCFHGYLLM